MRQNRPRAFILAAALTFAVGCAQQPAVSSVRSSPRATPQVAASTSLLGARAPDGAERTVEGVTLDFRFRSGGLSILVERSVTTAGDERLRLQAQRTEECRGGHPSDQPGTVADVECNVLWSVDRTVSGTMRVDEQLTTARVSTRLRGRPLSIRVEAAGAPDVRSNSEGGPLLVTTRDARAAARWGSHRWAWPNRISRPDAGTGLTFRRYE